MVLLVGCATVGPDYVPPEVSAPAQWNAQLEGGPTAERVDTQTLASWWLTLDDPTLTSLVERAIESNLDLHQARNRVREARARRGISEADRFPTIDATGSAKWRRTSEETGSGTERDLYAAGFDAGWELDLFGGIRRSIEAAEADLGASEEQLRDVLVTLVAEVALNYVEVRSFQARLSTARANCDAQEETYNLVRSRFEAGLTSQLDVEQAKANLESTRSQIPTLEIGLEQAKNRLAVRTSCGADPMFGTPSGNSRLKRLELAWPPPSFIQNSPCLGQSVSKPCHPGSCSRPAPGSTEPAQVLHGLFLMRGAYEEISRCKMRFRKRRCSSMRLRFSQRWRTLKMRLSPMQKSRFDGSPS